MLGFDERFDDAALGLIAVVDHRQRPRQRQRLPLAADVFVQVQLQRLAARDVTDGVEADRVTLESAIGLEQVIACRGRFVNAAGDVLKRDIAGAFVQCHQQRGTAQRGVLAIVAGCWRRGKVVGV